MISSIQGICRANKKSLHVANTKPVQSVVLEIDAGNAQNNASCGAKRSVTFLNKLDERFGEMRLQAGGGGSRGRGGAFAVPDSVHCGEKSKTRIAFEYREIAGFDLA